jgi:RNA polymerase sigma-70 factor, ECF subfamily
LSRSSPPSAAGSRIRAPARTIRSDGRQEGLALATEPAASKAYDGSAEGSAEVCDDSDLESVYRHHGPRVSRWAARLAGPGFDVEDIVHDVFLVVQRRLPEFRGDALVSTWLYEITVRVVQARRRWRRRRRWVWPFRTDARPAPETDQRDIVDDRVSPLEALERRQATGLLYRFLEELDEKHRTAVLLFEIEGMSCRDIATITGTSIENVWARVSRGREKLIRAFARWEAKGAT